MALNLLIPRIEWNEINFTGATTSGSDMITGITDTDEIKLEMAIKGTGIPDDTTVIDKTATTIQISQQATNTGTANLTAVNRFDFQYPPVRDSEDKYKTINKITRSLSGRRQVQTDYTEITREVEFDFLTQSERLFLQNNFYLEWARLGKEFKYFYDKADEEFQIWELANFDFSVPRSVKKHPYFLHKLKFVFTRLQDDETVDSLLLESGDGLLTEDGNSIALDG